MGLVFQESDTLIMDQNMTIKKTFPPAFKAKVAMEALKGAETPGQLSSKFSVHPIQIGVWKKKAVEAIEHIFMEGKAEKEKQKDTQGLLQELYQKIGKLEIENDFLKRKVGMLE
jgi:transposase